MSNINLRTGSVIWHKSSKYQKTWEPHKQVSWSRQKTNFFNLCCVSRIQTCKFIISSFTVDVGSVFSTGGGLHFFLRKTADNWQWLLYGYTWTLLSLPTLTLLIFCFHLFLVIPLEYVQLEFFILFDTFTCFITWSSDIIFFLGGFCGVKSTDLRVINFNDVFNYLIVFHCKTHLWSGYLFYPVWTEIVLKYLY